MRLVFMGTPRFAVLILEALLASPHQVVAVYTQPDRPGGRGRRLVPPPVKETALGHNVPVVQPRRLKAADELAHLRSLEPAVLVVAAYGQILPQGVLDIAPRGALNVHPSLLPRHRGPSPIASAILFGDEVTGVSIMLMDAGTDTGPVLSQRAVKIEPRDTTGTLSERLAQLGAELLMETLPLWLEGAIVPQPQDNAQATSSHMIHKEEGHIHWHRPASQIWRQVRAFQPWPGAYALWKGELLKIITATPLLGRGVAEPGAVVALEKPYLAGVQTEDGVLALGLLQREGRKVMTAEEFIRGQRDFIGSVLS